MGCRFVYAVVPEQSLENVIRAQALKKAEARIRRVSAHMSLEQQSLTKAQNDERIAMLAQELMRDMP